MKIITLAYLVTVITIVATLWLWMVERVIVHVLTKLMRKVP